MVTTSEKAARTWQGQVGLLWIDASHEYEDVRRDFDYWNPHLVPGGVVALHDCDKPGPGRVSQECLNPAGGFQRIESVDSIIVAKKLRKGQK